MGMVVQHNMNALNAYNKLNTNVAGLKKSSEKLASGYRINRAGDDAAGLAISEKMRSQIKGLNQAVRNSQDGINMIQTYEGAAQESHNILRRMKELASEAANGTYQNEVDRDAVQLEFNQLNDELNQIADTDFNGVVMLNGGQMADGNKAVNGKFDYVDPTVAPTKLGKGDVTVLGSDAWDDAGIADAAWGKLNSAWTRVTGQPATTGPESVDITFKYDKSTSSWEAVSANNGASIKNVGTNKTDNGGFEVTIGDVKVSNVVLDQTKLGNGDTITLTFNNPSTGISAPTNSTAKSLGDDNFTEHDLSFVKANNLTVANGFAPVALQKAADEAAAAKDAADAALAAKTTEMNDLVSEYDITYNAGAGTTTAAGLKVAGTAAMTGDKKTLADKIIAAYDQTQAATGGAPDTLKDIADAAANDKTAADAALAAAGAAKPLVDTDMTEDVNKLLNELDNASFTVNYTTAASKGSDFVLKLQNGTEIIDATGTGAAGTGTQFVIGDTTFKMMTNATTGEVTIKSDDEQTTYFTIAASVQGAATDLTAVPPVNNSTGSITWDLGIEMNEYDPAARPTVEVAKTGSVSKANNNTAANAPLTYTDHLVLQTGARTKDSVDFTMEYSTDGMGELKANLNISSRADGLNTANLSLNTQEDANYAIDRIDNAINKVSMVRATFGATQNRLEHKIDNLTTTAENIQEAESSIRDTDMASEMMNYTKFNILQQAAQSMLAQANQQPQSILQLLG